MGEMIVLGWVLLELTNSSFMVSVGMAVRMVPFLLFGIPAGAIADRVDRRKLMLGLGLGLAVVTSILSLIIMNDMLAVWHLFISSFIIGTLWTFYQTCRQSFAYDIVGPSHVVSAFAFISLGMRVGAIVASLAFGFFLDQNGTAICYVVITVSYIFSNLILMFAHTQKEIALSEGISVWQNMAEFTREIRRNSNLRALVVLTAAVEILGFSHQVLLPSLARDVLQVGSDGFGLIHAARALGGIIAVLLLSSFGDRFRKGLSFMIVLLLFGGALVLLGNASTFLLALIAVMIISGTATLSDVFSQSIMQTAVPNALRGRAMGAWVFAVGTAPLGQLQIGWLASTLGVGFALSTNGVGLAVLAIGCFALLPRLYRL